MKRLGIRTTATLSLILTASGCSGSSTTDTKEGNTQTPAQDALVDSSVQKHSAQPQPATKPAATFNAYQQHVRNKEWAAAARLLTPDVQDRVIREIELCYEMLYDIHGEARSFDEEPTILSVFEPLWKKHKLPKNRTMGVAALLSEKPGFIADGIEFCTEQKLDPYGPGSDPDKKAASGWQLPYTDEAVGAFRVDGIVAVATVKEPAQQSGTPRQVAMELVGGQWLVGEPPRLRKIEDSRRQQREAGLSDLTPVQQAAVCKVEALGGVFSVMYGRHQHQSGSRFEVLNFAGLKEGDLQTLSPIKDLTQLRSLTWLIGYSPGLNGGLDGRAGYFTDDMLQYVSRLPKLDNLDLGFTGVGDGGLSHLSHLTTLVSLALTDTKVTDAGLRHLSSLNRLETLDLNQTNVTKEGVERLRKQLPNCRISSDVDEGP